MSDKYFFSFYPFSEPRPIVESSIEDPVLGDLTAENPTNHHVTFQLVEEGSKRRKTKLVDSLGYSYNVRSKRSYSTYWQCVVRPRGNACKATVIQRDGHFHSGDNGHNHPAEAGALKAAKIVNLVKENDGYTTDLSRMPKVNFGTIWRFMIDSIEVTRQILTAEPLVKGYNFFKSNNVLSIYYQYKDLKRYFKSQLLL